jgi:intracellular sulfur oxidation DsrE/DsrF family protein
VKKEKVAMNEKSVRSSIARRLFLARIGGMGVAGATIVGTAATAEVTAKPTWQPARHAQDDWFDKVPGVHRLLFDTASAEGMASALQFASNFFTANHEGYGLKDSDLAVVIVARHKSAPFGYNDAVWTKYGKQFSEHAEFLDPKTKQPPTVNLYTTLGDGSGQPGRMDGLIKKGVHFAVCQMSTKRIAEKIAQANGLDGDSVLQEIAANLVGNARLVSAGIVAVNRAQEHGYTFVSAL